VHPRLLQIPVPFTDAVLPINSYGTMMAIGFLIGVYLASRRGKREGIEPSAIGDIGMLAIISGIAGARAFYVVQNWSKEFARNPLEIIRIDHGGLVFYGGFIAATVAVSIYLKRKRLPALKLLDIVTPSLAIGLAFTRIGCFLNGCCWGKLCSPNFPLGVTFPKRVVVQFGREQIVGSYAFMQQYANGLVDASASRSLPVHPTQLYSSATAFVLFLVVTYLYRFKKRDGEVLVFFAGLYSVARFILEFWRGDNPRLADGLTIAQNMSIGVFVLCVLLLIWGRVRLSKTSSGEEAGGGEPG